MKKYVISSEICRMPVVDMSTGRVIARSFVPYFTKENLSLSYFALSLDDEKGEDMFIPFSALCFINDLCTMINIPSVEYVPERNKCCKLIGTALTAKAGAVSLFNFGTISQTEVGENGEVISLTLSDGHTFLVPRDDTPENTLVNGALASEAFPGDSSASKRVSTSREREEPAQMTVAGARRKQSERVFGAKNTRESENSIEKFEKAFAKNRRGESSKKARAAEEETPAPAPAAPVSAPSAPEMTAQAQPEMAQIPAERAAKPAKKMRAARPKAQKQKFGVKIGRFKKYVAPIVAMLVYFVLYCIVSALFIQ